MTNKQKAQALWAVVTDRERSNPEHRAALDELVALKKAAKTSLDKLGVPQVMWDREDETNRLNASLAADLEAQKAEPLLQTREQMLMGEHLQPEPNLEEAVAAAVPPEQLAKDPASPAKAVAAAERGRITALVKHLLRTTALGYAAIVERVVAEFPEAKTTARSVASTAADMRKAKVDVPMRRAEAAK